MMIDTLRVKTGTPTFYGVVARRKRGTWGGCREGAGRKPEIQDARRYSLDFEGTQMEALEQIAAERGVSVATIVREACAKYLTRRRSK
jgi:hypothetical protein